MKEDMKIRVLHVLYKFNKGGLESRIMDILRDIDTSRFAFDFYIESGEVGDYDYEAKSLGSNIFYNKRNAKTRIPSFKLFDVFLRTHTYEYVCAYNQWSGWYLKAAKRNKVPYRIACAVTALQGLSIKNCIKNIVKKRVNKYANYRLAVSKLAGDWLFGSQEGKKDYVKIIPNAIDSIMYKFSEETRRETRKELGLEDDFVMIHVGNIRKVKNQSFAISVLAEILESRENAKLLLVGKIINEEKYFSELKRKAEEVGVTDKIRFLGQRNDVARLLQAADVFVFPSYYEGFPGAVLEAEASGLPCLISDSITEEVAISSRCKRLPLEKGADYWAKIILNTNIYDRADAWKDVSMAGYDIKAFSLKICDFLEESYRRLKRQGDLSELHWRLKQMLEEFTSVLEKYDILYFMGYGTLLGAARHKDIIPWDDDIDLTMPYDEFKKMLRLYAEGGFGENIFISSVSTDSSCANLFAKVVFKSEDDVRFREYFTHPDGLCIDVFPLYEASGGADSISQKILWVRIKALRRAVRSKEKIFNERIEEPVIKTIARIIYEIPFMPFSDQTLMEKAEKLCRINEGKGSMYFIDYGAPYSLEKEIILKKYFMGSKKLQLGSKEYNAPIEYKKVLEHIYGTSWMEPPPDKLRYKHSSLYV